MTKFYRGVSFVSWLLGLLMLIFAVIWRLAPYRGINLNVQVRSMLLLAAVLFLAAIASGGRTASA
jgi:ABC-type dipeptide/oligopeptide/nickel transport system permease component